MDVIEVPTLAETAAPDPDVIEAALASAEDPPAAEDPAAGSSSPSTSGEKSIDSAPRGRPPAGTRDPDRWSRAKMRAASKTQLRQRIEELQNRQPPAPAAETTPPAAEAPPAITAAELQEPLEQTFRAVSEVTASALGETWLLTDKETRALATVWAPIAAKHGGQLGEHLPLAVAILTTAGIVAPRVRKMREGARIAGAEDVTPQPPGNRFD
jgi:hypothetical protein